MLLLPLLAFALSAPSGNDILRDAAAGEKQQQILRSHYAYREHVDHKEIDKNGQLSEIKKTQDFDIVYLEGGAYRKLVLRNGKPLQLKEERKIEEDMRRTAAERRNQRKRGGLFTHVYRVRGGTLDDMVRLMDNVLLREDEIGGRKVWVIGSEPKADAKPNSAEDSKLLCYRHTYWIDQQEKVVIQRETEVIREGVDTKPGTIVRSRFAKSNGSIWLPSTMVIDFKVRPRGIANFHGIQEHSYSDFKKFDAESKIEFIDEVR